VLRSFIAWLDDYLAGESPSAIIRAIVGLLSFAVLLGALVGSSAVKAGLLVAVLLALTAIILLLLADRRDLRRKYEEHQRLVSRYCSLIAAGIKLQLTSWEQVTIIDPRGNAKERIIVHGRAPHNIQFVRLYLGPGWNQPRRYLRKVKVNARRLVSQDTPGTSIQLTSSWLANGKLLLLAHSPAPCLENGEVRLMIEWNWPGKCIPLTVHRVPDSFLFEFGKPIAYASQKVILPPGHDAYYEPVGFSENQEQFTLTRSTNDLGQVQFVFEAQPLEADHKAGMRLELKKLAP
jgi:hypothetical protein